MNKLLNRITLFTGLSLALLLAACGTGGSGAEPTINVPTLAGHASVGKSLPLVGAQIQFQNAAGQKIDGLSAQTGSSGEYVVDTGGRELPITIVALTTGGSVGGDPMTGSLRSVSQLASMGGAQLSINPISTVAEQWWRRHPGVTVEEAYQQANQALGLSALTDHDAATRLHDVMDSSALKASAIAIGGFDKWATQVVNQWVNGIASSFQLGDEQRMMGAGEFAAGMAWTMVSSAASSCDPSSSSVPGLGMLASTINSLGLVGTDPACQSNQMLSQISKSIDAIQVQLKSMDAARSAQGSALAGRLDKILDTVNKNAWTQAFSDYELNVARPVRRVLSDTLFLADRVKVHTNATGLPLDQLLNALTDPGVKTTTYSNAQLMQKAREIRSAAAKINQDYQSTPWIDSQDYADTMLWDRPDMPSVFNALHRAWLAINERAFVDASQQAAFAAVVEYFRQHNILRAAQHVDSMRAAGYSSETITAVMREWAPSDKDFARMMPTVLPWNQATGLPIALDPIPGPLRGANLGLKGMPAAGPVIDPETGLMWISACTQYFNGNGFNVDRNESCPYRGVMGTVARLESEREPKLEVHFQIRLPGQGNLSMLDAGPSWADLAFQLSPKGALSASGFARPGIAQLQTLRTKAMASGQDGPAIGTWLARHSSPNPTTVPAVFAGLDQLPSWTSGWHEGCGWRSKYYQNDRTKALMCVGHTYDAGSGEWIKGAAEMFDVKDGTSILNSPQWWHSTFVDECDSDHYGGCTWGQKSDWTPYMWNTDMCQRAVYILEKGFAGTCETVTPRVSTWTTHPRFNTKFFGPTAPSPGIYGEVDPVSGKWKPYDPVGVALGVLQLSPEQLQRFIPSKFTR